jgi:hypothetical protein
VQVFLAATSNDAGVTAVPAFSAVLDSQRERRHVKCSDPARADIILFPDCHLVGADWRLDGFANSELARTYPEKICVYDERDIPWCRYPGIYVSMPSRYFHEQWQVAAAYYTLAPPPPFDEPADEPDLLFSFIGSRTHSCRADIFTLSDPRAHVEEVTGFVFYDSSSVRFAERRARFADVMRRSMFVLCPRGTGTSSIRMYECLASGRVPVIIADDWVAPRGPSWADFSIRWPEARMAALPAYLNSRAGEFEQMSIAASAAFQTWFAPDNSLTRQLDQLEQLLRWQPRGGFPTTGYRDGAWRRAGQAAATATVRQRLSPVKHAVVRSSRLGSRR